MKKVVVIAIIVFILLLGTGIFIFNRQKNVLVSPLSQNPYPQGTKIENLKDFPEGFPKEVVLEKKPLQTVDTVKYPDGKQDITVAYISEKSLAELVGKYAEHLKKNKWTIKANQVMERSGAILASKDGGELVITIAPVSSGVGAMVTFSYKK